jgi:hypothetical protein
VDELCASIDRLTKATLAAALINRNPSRTPGSITQEIEKFWEVL